MVSHTSKETCIAIKHFYSVWTPFLSVCCENKQDLFFPRKMTCFSNNPCNNPSETCTYRAVIANQRYSKLVQTLPSNKNCLKNGIWVQHSRFGWMRNPKAFLFLSAFSSKDDNWSAYSIVWSQEIKLGKNANHCTIISSCGNYINKDFQKQLKKYRGNVYQARFENTKYFRFL